MNEKDRPIKSFADEAEQALVDSFAKLVQERRTTEDTLVIWQDGGPKEVSAREIKLPGE